jgi:hypothetical protein
MSKYMLLHTLCGPAIISQCETSWIKVMSNIDKARAALACLPRCNAKSRQSGVQCKNPGLGGGGKCRFHGGASTGRPPTHGRLTKANLINRDWVRLLLGVLATEHPGFKVSWFNPGSMTMARASEVMKAQKLRRR